MTETKSNKVKETDCSVDFEQIRKDFPILNKKINGKSLVYLDNAATTQKPKRVVDKISDFYLNSYSNIHRGVHTLSQEATSEFENARETVRDFINAKSVNEIIFTKGATEAINLVAHSFSQHEINEGDEIIISHLEHHANIVPWQQIAKRKKAKLKVSPINDDGDIIFDEFQKLLTGKTKMVALSYVSNSLGTVNDIKKFIDEAHKYDVPVLIDGSQAVQHINVNVRELDCDFFAFSGHKLYGPSGTGVLYGKYEHLEKMPPYQTGGDMINSVSFEETTFAELPGKFEAGTPNIAGIIGLAEAMKYINEIGISNIEKYETDLLNYALDKLKEVDDIIIYGNPKKRASVILFNVEGAHSNDIATMTDLKGIALRSGQHCTEPLMIRLNTLTTVRASIAFYNNKKDIDIFIEALKKVVKLIKA